MTQQVEALLTEHFRYTPLSLIDDIINTVNTIIYRAIEAIENGLFSIPPHQLGYSPDSDTSRDDSTLPDAEHPEAKDEIENGVHQLETLLEATVDKTFDRFEIYTLRNILTVPDELAPWMRLGHYEVCCHRPRLPFLSQHVLIEGNAITGPHTPPPHILPNPRIRPRSPAQSPRNQKTEPLAPNHPCPQRRHNLPAPLYSLYTFTEIRNTIPIINSGACDIARIPGIPPLCHTIGYFTIHSFSIQQGWKSEGGTPDRANTVLHFAASRLAASVSGIEAEVEDLAGEDWGCELGE
ncbi:MAG: hypothetical protein Q9201_006615 [Fulgogasparrea decipioides]